MVELKFHEHGRPPQKKGMSTMVISCFSLSQLCLKTSLEQDQLSMF